MAATVDGLRAYLRLPEDNTEPLSLYLDAAAAKAKAAGIRSYRNNAQYDLFLYALAAMYYDNRGVDVQDQTNMQSVINSFVLELRYSGEDDAAESDGTEEAGAADA